MERNQRLSTQWKERRIPRFSREYRLGGFGGGRSGKGCKYKQGEDRSTPSPFWNSMKERERGGGFGKTRMLKIWKMIGIYTGHIVLINWSFGQFTLSSRATVLWGVEPWLISNKKLRHPNSPTLLEKWQECCLFECRLYRWDAWSSLVPRCPLRIYLLCFHKSLPKNTPWFGYIMSLEGPKSGSNWG